MSSNLGAPQLRGEARWLRWNRPWKLLIRKKKTNRSPQLGGSTCCMLLLIFDTSFESFVVGFFLCVFFVFCVGCCFQLISYPEFVFDMVWYGLMCLDFLVILVGSAFGLRNLYRTFWKVGMWYGLSTSYSQKKVHTDWVWLGPTTCHSAAESVPKGLLEPSPRYRPGRVWGRLQYLSHFFFSSKDPKKPTEAILFSWTWETCHFSKPTFLDPENPRWTPTGVGTVRRLPMGSRELELPKLKPKRSHWAPQAEL